MKRWEVEIFAWNLGRHEDARWVSHHWTHAGAAAKQWLVLSAVNRKGGSYRTFLTRTGKAARRRPANVPVRSDR